VGGGTGEIVGAGEGAGFGVAVGDWGVGVGDSGTLVTSGTGVNEGATTGVAGGMRVETALLTVGGTVTGLTGVRGTV
jgi:hypothetical protein